MGLIKFLKTLKAKRLHLLGTERKVEEGVKRYLKYGKDLMHGCCSEDEGTSRS